MFAPGAIESGPVLVIPRSVSVGAPTGVIFVSAETAKRHTTDKSTKVIEMNFFIRKLIILKGEIFRQGGRRLKCLLTNWPDYPHGEFSVKLTLKIILGFDSNHKRRKA
jgi:hypothetical protein